MTKPDPVLDRIKEIVFALPQTKLTMTWGQPHFRVGDKIFCGYGEDGGKGVLSFKLPTAEAAAQVKKPGFRKAPYVGHKGWVSMDAAIIRDWSEVQAFIIQSYRLIAPKKLVTSLGAMTPSAKPSAKPGAKPSAKRSKKTTTKPAAPRGKTTHRPRRA